MANLTRWTRPSMLSLQRDLEDILDDFSSPRAFRREMDRLFDEVTTPQLLFRQMDTLLDEFESPPSMRRRVAGLFDDFVGAIKRPFSRGKTSFVPSLELVERDGEYVMKTDLPGIREQDIDVSIDDGNVLTISGERREEETRRVRGYEYSERGYGAFSRSVSLPPGIDASRIAADFRNGVLEIHVPKTAAAVARKIPLSRESREEPRVIAPSNGPAVQATQVQTRTTS